MDSKKRFATMDSLFQNIDPYGQGALPPAAAASITVVYLPLDQVRPDPAQPRRVLPPTVDAAFRQTGDAPAALAAWASLAQSDEPARVAYQGLTGLADTLAADGLINPITVMPLNDGYQIVSGERRWWAHHWLAAQSRAVNHGQPGRIAALVRRPDEITPTLQLVENLHRQDLCAVEVALGLATLIERLESPLPAQSGTMVPLSPVDSAQSATVVALSDTPPPQSGTVVPLSPADPTQSGTMVPLSSQSRLIACRQVANRRRPEGTWATVVERLGKSRRHWVHYLDLLRLTDESLQLAWKHHLSERALRPAVAEKDPARQLRLVERLVQQQRTETDEQSVAAGAATTDLAARESIEPFSRLFAGELRAFQRTFDRAAEQHVPPAALAKELAQTANFDELIKTAKRLKPFIDAIVQTAAKK